MLVELSPPLLAALFVVMGLALVVSVVRATGLTLRALSVAIRKPRLLPERVEPAAVAERLAAKVEAHPTVAFSERFHGVPVAVWPAFPVGFTARPEWRVLVGVELESVADVDGIRTVVADRLAALEAERARVVR